TSAALVGYLSFYKALALGPVSIVSPIAAGDGAVAALVGVVLLGERPTLWQIFCVSLLVVGVILAPADPRDWLPGWRKAGRGVLLALVTMFGFGLALAGIAALAKTTGSAVLPVLLIRTCLLLPLLPAVRGDRVPLVLVLGALGVGLLDTGSLLALARG